MTRRALAVLATLFAAGLLAKSALAPAAPPPSPTHVRLAPTRRPPFARAETPRAFRLPEDHGPHFEFETEWWYYTGNLKAEDGRRFGFQLTFFRRGLAPGPPPAEGLATNQIYFAHFAVTDVAAGRHRFAERWSRGAAGLSGARPSPFAIWLEGWSAKGEAADAVWLSAQDEGSSLELSLHAAKPLVLHGRDGLSPKSDEPGNASYYVSYTRMTARGRVNGVPATGEAWFDHEWSTSVLGPSAVGWDWWSLQLDDGRELMYFQIRRGDGGPGAASGGTLVTAEGKTRRLGPDDVRIEVTGHFTSQETKAEYPGRWRLYLPSEELVLEVEPWVADQEMRTSFTYWEGAVRFEGTSHGAAVGGHGYVELTGYARSMQGVF
jgi:predicted secreted hydrolase